MWQIVHGTYFERVGRGVIPHGPGSVMDWTQEQAESYGLERLRKVAQVAAADNDGRTLHTAPGSIERPKPKRGRPRKAKKDGG